MERTLRDLAMLPVLIFCISDLYLFYLISSFRNRAKKIKPELAFKRPFFILGFPIFLPKEKRDSILGEVLNIKSIKKLNNNELNKYILKIEKFDKMYSHIFGFLMVTILGLAIIGWILNHFFN